MCVCQDRKEIVYIEKEKSTRIAGVQDKMSSNRTATVEQYKTPSVSNWVSMWKFNILRNMVNFHEHFSSRLVYLADMMRRDKRLILDYAL